MSKENIKQTISDGQLRDELIKLFESGMTAKSNSYELLRTKYKLEKQRCLRMFDFTLSEWQELKDKATNEQIGANVKEMLQNGLKSKIDWILEIQKELEENRVEESVLDLKTGKVIRFYRTMTPTERKGYIERIAKFSGLDSPNKIAQTDPDGNPVITSSDIKELHAIVDLLNGKK